MDPTPDNPTGGHWICADTEAQLCDFLDGALAPELCRSMESHAGSCADCAAAIANVRDLLPSLQKVESLEPPPELNGAILDATLGPRRARSRWDVWVDSLAPVTRPGFAYSAVTLLVTAIVISQAFGFSKADRGISKLNPVNLFHAANRDAHQAYARSAKMVSDLRLVYEIQTRLHPDDDLERADESLPEAPAGGEADSGPRQPEKFRNSEKLWTITSHGSGTVAFRPAVFLGGGPR